MYGHASTVGHHYPLYVLQFLNHALGANVVGAVPLLYITGTRVLVVAAQRLKHIAYGELQRCEHLRVYGYLVLFQITAKTVDLHDTRNTRQLSPHHPVLYGAQLHRIIVALVLLVHTQHVLVNLAQTRGDRHHLRGTQLRWNLPCHRLNLLVDELARL